MNVIYSFLITLLAVSNVFAETPSEAKYDIRMSCLCTIYNEDGVVINPKQLTSPKIDTFGYAYGEQLNVGPAEAALCDENSFEDLTASCPRAYARVKGQCMEQARVYNSDIQGFLNYSIEKSSCFKEVILSK